MDYTLGLHFWCHKESRQYRLERTCRYKDYNQHPNSQIRSDHKHSHASHRLPCCSRNKACRNDNRSRNMRHSTSRGMGSSNPRYSMVATIL